MNYAHKKVVTLNTKFKFFFELSFIQTKDLIKKYFLKFNLLMNNKLKIKFLEKR